MTHLQHPFGIQCYDIPKLMDGVTKINPFIKRLAKQGQENPFRIPPEDYLGFGFEAFVESLVLNFGIDKRIYVDKYQPIISNDMGVDGLCYRPNGDVVTIQAKARQDATVHLNTKKDQIANFVAHSKTKYNAKPQNMLLFTTGAGVNHTVADGVFNGEVRVYNNMAIRKFVDNNEFFWRRFRDQLEQRRANG